MKITVKKEVLVLSACVLAMFQNGCAGRETAEADALAPVPVVQPPFAGNARAEIIRPELKYGVNRIETSPGDFIEVNSLLFRLRIFCEGEAQAMVFPVTDPGFPWGTYERKELRMKKTLDADEKGVVRSVRYEKPPRGSAFDFREHIRDLGGNRCRVTTKLAFDKGSKQRMAFWKVLLENPAALERGDFFVVSADGKRHRFAGGTLNVADPVGCDYVTPDPGGFSIKFDGRWFASAKTVKIGKDVHCLFAFGKAPADATVSYVYDGGMREKEINGPGTVNGTDFRRFGAVDFAHYDVKRNLLVNPSFESGARYWYIGRGQNAALSLCEDLSRSGTRSMDVGIPVQTFSLPLEERRDHVLSFYARSRTPQGRKLDVRFLHPYGPRPPRKPPKGQSFKPTAEWRRFSYRFNAPFKMAAFQFSGKDVLIDDVQLEEGTEPTPYAGNPYGLQLENDGEDPYFAEAGKPIGCRLVLRGESGAKGRLEIEVEDFFGRITHTATVAYALDASGASRFPIPDSAFRYKGANVVKVRVVPKNGLAYTDYLRFSVFKYADGTAKNRHLHEYSSLGLHNRMQLEIPESTFRMMKVTGIAPRCRSIQDEKGVYPPEMAKAIVKRYTDIGGVTIGYVWADSVHSGFGTQLVNMLKERGFENPVKSPHLSDALLEALEEVASIIVKNAPWCDVWIGPDEISGSWECARDKSGEAAARLLMAMHRGVKKGNPEATFICYSTCHNDDVSRGEIERFFKAAKKIDPDFRFDAVDPHCYREFYDEPGFDVDDDWAKTFALLDRLGYASMPAYSFGGGYCYPFMMDCWNRVSPWARTGVKDCFNRVHVPGYALGWGERAAAAMQLRYNLAAYKYAPRLRSNTNWDPKMLDGENPHAPNVGTAAQTEMLGNGTFLEDVRFHAGSRAYIFDDGAGNATAVFWKFTKDLDRGRERGETVSLALRGVDAKFYDMMANEVAPLAVAEGRPELPLSNFPVYVRVPLADAGKLSAAFENAVVK